MIGFDSKMKRPFYPRDSSKIGVLPSTWRRDNALSNGKIGFDDSINGMKIPISRS
jgi:hypothetical protein